MSTEVTTAFLLAQLAQNSGWNTSQVASKGLTTPLKPVLAPFPAKCLIPKKADSHPGSATTQSSKQRNPGLPQPKNLSSATFPTPSE
jgi:hypothetical protein